ncbi:ankyrin repeat domain-containing protein [Spirulina sp. CS-785/01]|uniref:protein kinase domain-containing protein n=1 Tax=Spirulina sp. CS-785/01 TaxID=3021716 RepID=UPI002330D5E3|nr:ankyrin repeat domain-containing protein [Spirulina sp. CS-785/01]MDB9312149.1 ankyrin repeat domain-containing protein [Spirulina sp. CS-785/01]
MIHQIGEIIAEKYYLLNLLGEGSSGITYAAKHLKTGQKVALKVLSLQHIENIKFIELFEREAQVLKTLQHPNIPQYLDFFPIETEQNYCFYLVQELVEGQSLERLVQQGWRATPTEIRQITEQLLTVLTYLHQLSPPVIHRDIKPHNLILKDKGKIFLVDFGSVQNTYQSTLARSSTVVGTYGYMAPEQFIGKAVPGTDLYSVGATLLFLLTHRSPSEFPTDRLTIDFRSSVTVSEGFALWLEQMLAPDLQDRFSSAENALNALRSQTIKPPSVSTQRRVLGASLLAIALLGGIFLNTFKYPILSRFGFTPYPFYTAIRDGDAVTVQEYLERGVQVNTRDMDHSTPLHWSVSNGHPDVAKLLLDQGAKIDVAVNSPRSPDEHQVLHTAVHHNDPELVQLLLDYGADINARDAFGRTPLHHAISKPNLLDYYGMTVTKKQPSPEIIELLVRQGANINAQDNQNRTPLDYARQKRYSQVVQQIQQGGHAYE